MAETAANLAVEALTQQPQSSTQPSGTVVTALPDDWVDKIFAKLLASFGSKFVALFKSEKTVDIVKSEWAEALAGLSVKQIVRALEKARAYRDWNPSIAEFLRMACDLPDLDTCAERVLTGKNIDPVSYRVSSIIGQYSLSQMTYPQLRSRIRGIYPDVYALCLQERIGNDEEFSAKALLSEQPAAESPKPEKAPPEVAGLNIAQMREALAK